MLLPSPAGEQALPDFLPPPSSLRDETAQPLVLGRWFVGALASGLLLWAFGAEFVNSIEPEQFDEKIGRHLPRPGAKLRFRSEGWATTRYASHGLLADDVEAKASFAVGVWGDSFIQSAHVDDDEKFGARFRERWVGQPTVTTVAVGYPGRAVADVVALLPRYEAIKNFSAHVVVLPDLFDVSPNGTTFIERPRFEFSEHRREPPWPALRERLARSRLDFLWTPIHRLFVAHRNPIGSEPLRWRVGPVPTEANRWRRWPELYDVDPAAWQFALRELRASTDAPLAILYAPRVPYLDDGRVLLEHPVADLAARFGAMCRQEGIEFIDLSGALAAHFESSGRTPMGFHNGRIGRGHLNGDGQKVLADALILWASRVLDGEGSASAVHPD